MSRTYGAMHLTPEGDSWWITALEPHVRIRLKHLFPRIQKSADVPYRFANDAETCADLEWFLQRYPVEISAADKRQLLNGRLRFEDLQNEVDRILSADYRAPSFAGLRDGMRVRDYQAQAVEVLRVSKGLLIGDEVGLGKTYMTAAACLLPDALPAVIVCHAHLQRQWCEVIERFTTLTTHAIRGTRPYPIPPCDVRVFRYSQLLGWADYFETVGAGLAAWDEIQELRRGTDSEKGKASMRLANACRYRLGLSATPIYNYGREIFSVMQFLNGDALGDYWDFVREWAPNGRISDAKALGTYLREKRVFLRRTKHDVGQEMPAVNRIVDVIDYDEETLASVESLAHQLAVKASSGAFTERGQATRELDLLMRQQTGVAKARQVAAFARILVEGGEPIVLVGWHRDVYDIWLDALKDLNPVMYTGSESEAQKHRSKQAFLSGESNILIMSLRSGAGLDGLQARCSTMVFGELDWSPGVHHQCIGRLDREGQTSPVTAIFLVVEEGSDPPMMEMLGLKASEASAIVDPTLGVQKAHSDGEGLRRLVQRYLEVKGSASAARLPDPVLPLMEASDA